MKAQLNKIDVDKWCEGFRLNRDPGQPYVMDWIDENGAWFRGAWNDSLCQRCKQWHDCGHLVRANCEDFDHER